jgi:hypothetical protein
MARAEKSPEIRTQLHVHHATLQCRATFKTGALNHSAILPSLETPRERP